MKNYRYILAAVGMAAVFGLSGCGSGGTSAVVQATTTPTPTPAPTEVPATVTPIPTSTPAPKVIGVKTSTAKYIYLTNNLQVKLREIYLSNAGMEEWGKNLIPSESFVDTAEQVQMYYTSASTASDTTETADGESTGSTDTTTLYDIKIVTTDGSSYTIYSVALGDMESASLVEDTDTSSVYLRYMSLSENSEKDTRDNVQTTVDSDDSSEDDTTYDDTYYDDSTDYSDDYSDDSTDYSDDYSDDSSDYSDYSDDGSGDDSYYYDDDSYDDGYTYDSDDTGSADSEVPDDSIYNFDDSEYYE